MPHDGHDHDDQHSELSPIALRVRALESLLVEKGYVDPAALDVLIDTYETKIGPRKSHSCHRPSPFPHSILLSHLAREIMLKPEIFFSSLKWK